MEITRQGSWVRTADGRWINLANCDLIEVSESDDSSPDARWHVLAWNAMQPQLDAFVLVAYRDEKQARRYLDALMASLGQA